MSDENDYTYWEAALAGKRPPVVEDDPQPGWYRQRMMKDGPWLPVVIWKANGKTFALLNFKPVDAIRAWNSCCHKPVTYEAYEHYEAKKEWPGDLPEKEREALDAPPLDPLEEMIGRNSKPETKLDEMRQLIDALEKLIEPIKSEAQATLFKNYRDRALQLIKDADAELLVVLSPLQEQIRPIVEKMDAIKFDYGAVKESMIGRGQALRKELTDWLVKQEAKAKEQAPQGGEATRARVSGSGRATALRTTKKAKIVDYNKCLLAFAENAKVKDLIQQLANAAVRSGNLPDGCEVIEEKSAA